MREEKIKHENHRYRSYRSARYRDGSVASWNISAADTGVAAGYNFTLISAHTDEGNSGIGLCDAPSLAFQAVVDNSMGLKALMLGEDPREVQRPWQKMYNATGLYRRRGVVIGNGSG